MAHQLNPSGEGISPELTDPNDPVDRTKVIVNQSTSSELEVQRVSDVVYRTKKHTKFEKRSNDMAVRLQVLTLAAQRTKYGEDTDDVLKEAEKLYAWVTKS